MSTLDIFRCVACQHAQKIDEIVWEWIQILLCTGLPLSICPSLNSFRKSLFFLLGLASSASVPRKKADVFFGLSIPASILVQRPPCNNPRTSPTVPILSPNKSTDSAEANQQRTSKKPTLLGERGFGIYGNPTQSINQIPNSKALTVSILILSSW